MIPALVGVGLDRGTRTPFQGDSFTLFYQMMAFSAWMYDVFALVAVVSRLVTSSKGSVCMLDIVGGRVSLYDSYIDLVRVD